MAIRKNENGGEGKSLFGALVRKLKWILRTLYALLLIALGGVLFNLDRMDHAGITLLKYKHFLPSAITRFLPGGTADYGSALPEQRLDGEIIEVYDGDTATLLTPDNRKYRVRFFGIDAPEAAQGSGIAARDALREKILGRRVTVHVAAVDRYGRAVGKVMLGGRYINLEMVAEGWAWYYADYAAREYDLASAEKEARQRALGLWKTADPQPPWEWRRAHKAP